MSNLTISVDDEIVKRARVRAIQQGSSVSAKIREFLEHYVNESDDVLKQQRLDATSRLMQAIEAATPQAQPGAAIKAGRAKPARGLRDECVRGRLSRPRPGEDLSHGQSFGALTVVNPFLSVR